MAPAPAASAVDTRFHRSQEMIDNNVAAEISWDRVPQSVTTRGYQHNVTLDGKPYVIQEAATPGATVVIPEGSDLLKAYKVTHNGQTYYNVPNVLSGADPFGYAKAIKAAAKAAGKDENYYLSIPISAAAAHGCAGCSGRSGWSGRWWRCDHHPIRPDDGDSDRERDARRQCLQRRAGKVAVHGEQSGRGADHTRRKQLHHGGRQEQDRSASGCDHRGEKRAGAGSVRATESGASLCRAAEHLPRPRRSPRRPTAA